MSPSRPPAPKGTPQRRPPAPKAKPPAPKATPRTAAAAAERAAGASTAGAAGVADTAAVRTPTSTSTTYEVRRFRGPARPAVVSTRSAERFAERAKAARNLARRQIAYVVGGAVAIVALGYLVLFSPVFRLDPAKVTITGAGTVVAVDQVDAVVARYVGTPLPRLSTADLRADVLEVPGVREASVTRHWPQGLTVTLVSREPVAAVPEPADSGGAGFALLDEEGVQVGRTDAAPADLPVVGVPVEEPRTLQAVLSVLRELPDDLVAQVADVSAQTQDTIAMTLRDGVRVEWGSADETALKTSVLSALRASPAAAGASVIDVSAPRLPITR